MVEQIVIDAKDQLVGRFATKAATASLHGKEVHIINCSKAVISGEKRMIIDHWKRRHSRGVPKKGPFIRRTPDRFVRRMIRGMLPYKTPRGRDAYKRIICHVGVPEVLKDAKAQTFDGKDKLPHAKFITIDEICKELGGKWNE